MKKRSSKRYTVYRDKDDALIAFEEPSEKCAELMGTTLSGFYSIASRGKRGGYTVIKTNYADPG